jgi:hypothetical protein
MNNQMIYVYIVYLMLDCVIIFMPKLNCCYRGACLPYLRGRGPAQLNWKWLAESVKEQKRT